MLLPKLGKFGKGSSVSEITVKNPFHERSRHSYVTTMHFLL